MKYAMSFLRYGNWFNFVLMVMVHFGTCLLLSLVGSIIVSLQIFVSALASVCHLALCNVYTVLWSCFDFICGVCGVIFSAFLRLVPREGCASWLWYFRGIFRLLHCVVYIKQLLFNRSYEAVWSIFTYIVMWYFTDELTTKHNFAILSCIRIQCDA